MKKVIILRHAQADYAFSGGDFDMPLSSHGENEATLIANYMLKKSYTPDFIYCSAAKRTQMTLAAIREDLSGIKTDIRKDFYLADTGFLYEELKAADDNYDTVMIIAHNPGLHSFAAFLTGAGDARHIRSLQMGYPTACLSLLECPVDSFSEIMPAQNKLVDLMAAASL